ncbi:MAG: L-glutamate gamma-semialdehyde dehydrogenase [Steroidobacteraceae bacterium]
MDRATPRPSRNETVREYRPESGERASLKAELSRMSTECPELPLIIGGQDVLTGRREAALEPHNHHRTLAHAHLGGAAEANVAIAAAGRAWIEWSRASPCDRAAVFLKAAELLSGPWRDRLNAATMLGQSKTVYQAEIDSAAELIDFWRFNVEYMFRVHEEQPFSPSGVINTLDYRPLEGFVFAVSPFNFTAIAGNLPTAPALMGNTVLWKPSATAKYSAYLIMRLLQEAGLPDGVINLVYGDAAEISAAALSHSDLAGVHFTGSTAVFDSILQRTGQTSYRNYPRIVGETGGKNFIIVHPTADLDAVVAAVIRGAFEYQGQKCSAASRLFVPRSVWARLSQMLEAAIATIRMGDVRDFRNFMGAVIDEKSWRRLAGVVGGARQTPGVRVLAGGGADMTQGYFIEPTLLEVDDSSSRFMTEEFFGPIASAFVYPDKDYDAVLELIDSTTAYGLTGAVFARDAAAIAKSSQVLRYAAGNFYVNDKPTGAVVGQQPFGGARASGTNDKAGSIWNLIRWVSPRTVKTSGAPPTDYRYPFMQAE